MVVSTLCSDLSLMKLTDLGQMLFTADVIHVEPTSSSLETSFIWLISMFVGNL